MSSIVFGVERFRDETEDPREPAHSRRVVQYNSGPSTPQHRSDLVEASNARVHFHRFVASQLHQHPRTTAHARSKLKASRTLVSTRDWWPVAPPPMTIVAAQHVQSSARARKDSKMREVDLFKRINHVSSKKI
jgi:hypothetical protein